MRGGMVWLRETTGMDESEEVRVVTQKRRKDPQVAMEASESSNSAKRAQYPPVDVSKTSVGSTTGVTLPCCPLVCKSTRCHFCVCLYLE